MPYSVDDIAQVGGHRKRHFVGGFHFGFHYYPSLSSRSQPHPSAQANIDVFRRCMPVAIRTANFLSGGQSLADAAARLSVMNKKKGNFPVGPIIVCCGARPTPPIAPINVICSMARLASLLALRLPLRSTCPSLGRRRFRCRSSRCARWGVAGESPGHVTPWSLPRCFLSPPLLLD